MTELQKIQSIIVKICTEEGFRKQFFENPYQIAHQYGVSESVLLDLANEYKKNIDFYAISLHQKRLGILREILPLSFKALQGSFDILFWDYAPHYLPNGFHRYQKDAYYFCLFILEKKSVHKQAKKIVYYESQLKRIYAFPSQSLLLILKNPIQQRIEIFLRIGKWEILNFYWAI